VYNTDRGQQRTRYDRNRNRYFDRTWNRDNINHSSYDESEELRDIYNENDESEFEDMDIYEWDEPNQQVRVLSRSRDLSAGTKRGGSMHMNSEEKQEFNQRRTNDNLQEIMNDFAKIKDMMDCMIKEQSSMKEELEKIKIQNNINLKDKTVKTNKGNENQSKKRDNLVYNTGKKRSRDEENTSNSDINAANNVFLLSNQMNNADNTMKNMMKMLQNMNEKFEQIYNNQENNTTNYSDKNDNRTSAIIKGDNNASSSTTNNI
jgi:archaellum component FlaC